MLPLQARVDLGVMAMKGCSAFPKAPALLEPHHQIDYQDTRWWGVTLLQRSIRCIQQPQPTEQFALCGACMFVWMCVQVYTCVWLWVDHRYVYTYMCVHIGAQTYLRGNHWFSSASIKCRRLIKGDQAL